MSEEDKRGFVTLGINTGEDNIRYCYALALSIKACDPGASVTLIVDKGQLGNVQSFYEHAFDYMIELPHGNSAHKDGFHGMNLWQVYHATPYEETIYVDYDTLFVNVDMFNLWKIMGNDHISMPNKAYTYRRWDVPIGWRFEFELQYSLPQLYSNMIYFNKHSKVAEEWFKMCDPVFQNWRQVYSRIFTDKKPEVFNKNILSNMVTHFLDVEKDIGVHLNNHYDLHALSHGAFPSREQIPEHWTDMMNYWVTDEAKIQVENSIINSGIIHYSDETFLTDEIIDVFKSKATKRV
tara:strand:- start:3479 stop:4357 length:879 start_codon:yes stop_codon:yes gene_type:complete